MQDIELELNGQRVRLAVSRREHLADALRQRCGLTGTHLGCEHGVCGACTVRVDGAAVRGCLMLAVQADGARVRTIEGEGDDPVMRALQDAFVERNALQCGYCTPGFLLTAAELIALDPDPSRESIRAYLSGNLCRCTGYQAIVDAVELAARRLREAPSTDGRAR
ncbi:MAG: (2Fe-2S)-binding protein [bacterium]|jgi:carbon-monoxide dehydrogenase small subunit|nr:(2Fe-2S)-binding protein [Betaproteobacteria bacterium]